MTLLTLSILALWYAVEVGIITYVHKRGDKCVGFAVLVNMILIFVAGGYQVELFGWHTNAMNVAYASVFYAVSLVARDHGFLGTLKMIKAVFIGSVSFLLIGRMLHYLPIVQGNEQVAHTISGIFEHSGQFVMASIFAFWASNTLNLFFVTKGHKILGNVLGQFADSVIFSPVAFYGILPRETIIEFYRCWFSSKGNIERPRYPYLSLVLYFIK